MLRVLNVVTKKVDCITNIVNLTLLVMNRQVQHLLLVTRLLFICHMLPIPAWCITYMVFHLCQITASLASQGRFGNRYR